MDEGDVVRHLEAGAVLQVGAVEDQRDIHPVGQFLAEIGKLSIHRFGIGHRHQLGVAFPRLGTVGAEKMDEFVLGLAGCPRPAAGVGPDPAVAALPAEVCFILKPKLNSLLGMTRLRGRQGFRPLII